MNIVTLKHSVWNECFVKSPSLSSQIAVATSKDSHIIYRPEGVDANSLTEESCCLIRIE